MSRITAPAAFYRDARGFSKVGADNGVVPDSFVCLFFEHSINHFICGFYALLSTEKVEKRGSDPPAFRYDLCGQK